VANLIPSLVELKLDLLSRKAEVVSVMEGRKAAPFVRKTVKLEQVVLMNRANIAEFPLAAVSEVLGGSKASGQGRKALAKKANNETKAAEAAFCVALFGALRVWSVEFTDTERAQMARKLSTASRARLIASDVLAGQETVGGTVRPRFEHRSVEAPKGAQKAAITRERKVAEKVMGISAVKPAPVAWAFGPTDAARKAAKKATAQKRTEVMAVISAIFGLLAEKRALQAQVNWHFQKFAKSVALDITVELRAQIQLLNEQLDKLVLAITSADMRFMAFKAYRMVTGQVKAALKREAKAEELAWKLEQQAMIDCTFNENVFVWSLSELFAA
jgi:hypothetical protein